MKAEDWLKHGGDIPDEDAGSENFHRDLDGLLSEPTTAAHVLDDMDLYKNGFMRLGKQMNSLWTTVRDALDQRQQDIPTDELGSLQSCLIDILYIAWRANPGDRHQLAPMIDPSELGRLFRNFLNGDNECLDAITPARCLQSLLNDESSLKLVPKQWELVAKAARALLGRRPTAEEAMHLAILGLAGHLHDHPEWDDILSEVNIDEDKLVAIYQGFSCGRIQLPESTEATESCTAVMCVMERRQIRNAMEAMGYDHSTIKLEGILAQVSGTDPWTRWTKQAFFQGGDLAIMAHKCLHRCASEVGMELSDEDDTLMSDPCIWTREAHLRFWFKHEPGRVHVIAKTEIDDWGIQASAVGRFRLELIRHALITGKKLQDRAGYDFVGKEQRRSLNAYRRGEQPFFTADFAADGTSQNGSSASMNVEWSSSDVKWIIESSSDQITVLLKGLDNELVADLTQALSDLLDTVEKSIVDRSHAATKNINRWLVGFIRKLEREHQVMFQTDQRAVVVKAYEHLRSLYFDGEALEVVDIEAGLAFAGHAVAEGIQDAEEAFQNLIDLRVQTLLSLAPENESLEEVIENIKAAAVRLNQNPNDSFPNDVWVAAIRSGKLPPPPPKIEKISKADPFLNNRSSAWLVIPSIMLTLTAVMIAWLLVTYWPFGHVESVTRKLVPDSLPSALFDPLEEGFQIVRVHDRKVWVMLKPVTERVFDQLIPRSAENDDDDAPAVVTCGEAKEWCALYIKLLREKYPQGLKPNDTWTGTVGRPLSEEEWKAVGECPAGSEWVLKGNEDSCFLCGTELRKPETELDQDSFRVVIQQSD